jgi:hypothetical protein
MNELERLIKEIEQFGENTKDIELIKTEYPYLLNYLKIKDTMKFTNDLETIKRVGDCLKEDIHCPCSIVKNENTICPCYPCRKVSHCHCGIFEKR